MTTRNDLPAAAASPGSTTDTRVATVENGWTTPRTSRRPGRPPNGDSESTRRQLIDAAIECFGERGLARTTLRDVSLRAGLTTGTLYHHFATKETLYIEAYRSCVEELYRRYNGAIDGKELLADRICAMIDCNAEMALQGSLFNPFVLRAWVEHGEEGALPLPIPPSVLLLLNKLVDDAVSAGEVDEADRPQVLDVVRACLWGISAISLTGSEHVPTTAAGLKRLVSASLIRTGRQRSRPQRGS